MDKLLPIKFFEKRTMDEMHTEAGGGDTIPKWQLQDAELKQRSEHLAGGMAKVAEVFQERKQADHELPLVMATTISEDSIAKTHRKSIVNLLTSDSSSNVIGVDVVNEDYQAPTIAVPEPTQKSDDKEPESARRILSTVVTDELIANIGKALGSPENSPKLISSILGFEPFKARVSKYNPANKAYRVILVDYNDAHMNELARLLFKNKCSAENISIETETRYSKDMYMYRITLDSAEDMETVQNFEGVFSIEETQPIRIGWDQLDSTSIPQPKAPQEGTAYPIVGVLDSGIARNEYLLPWLLDESEEYYGPELLDKSHGSMVASVLEYSDELNGTDYFATDGVMMLEAVIAPDFKKETIYPEDMIDNVRDAVERHKDIKIWTMSAGTTEECDRHCFSQYGIALDNIEDENQVLIIKSSGNSYAYQQGKENERIAKMADSVRSLVVGSIAHKKGSFDASEIGMPSPFTRQGPGPAYIIKPDLVAYGGNAGMFFNKNYVTGVKVFDLFGTPSSAAGTSFSTPWVARIAAELAFLLDGDFDPLLIKALMIHSASYPAGEKMDMRDKKRLMGFGMPAGTRDILYNSENEITLVLRDYLEKGTFIEIMDFPFSKSLAGDDGRFHGQVTVTVVSQPILNSSNGMEYCQSDTIVKFGTMERIVDRDTNKRNVRNPYGHDKSAQNILTESLYSRKVMNILEEVEFGKERTLLRLGDKFYPVKKYAIDLDEMTDANKVALLGRDRKWYLKVEALFRDSVEREYSAADTLPKQQFCILITIKDPTGKAPVYNEVTQQLQEKNFAYTNVQLRNEIREHVEY